MASVTTGLLWEAEGDSVETVVWWLSGGTDVSDEVEGGVKSVDP